MTNIFCLLLALGAGTATIERTEQRGPVSVTIELEPDQPLIGDPVTMTIRVTAEKDIELLMPEFGEALDRFTILDFVPRRELAEDNKTLATQKYRLQPPTSGKHAIPPILIEFVDHRAGQPAAPDGQDAYEILAPRIDFTVQSVLPDDATAELKPPLGELQPLGRSAARRWSPLIALALAALALAIFAHRYWQRARQISRRRTAYEIARRRLDRLMARPRQDHSQIDAFFVELSGIVRQYLEDRFDLRAPELTTEEFLESVSDSPDLSGDHQALLRGFLRQADLVKFAGIQPSARDIDEALAAAGRFLDETQQNAPLIEDPERAAIPVGSAGENTS
jgi:hypothetical protein